MNTMKIMFSFAIDACPGWGCSPSMYLNNTLLPRFNVNVIQLFHELIHALEPIQKQDMWV